MKPVYLAKPGVVCAGGLNLDELWKNVIDGNQYGIVKVTACNGKEFFAGRIDGGIFHKCSGRFDMKVNRMEEKCLLQIEQQIEQVLQKYGADKVGVCVGSCDNGSEFSVAGHKTYFQTGRFPVDYSLEMQGADYVASFVSEKYGLKGPCLSFSTACSSSAGAIIKAAQLIKSGICDAVVAGGVDVVSDTVLLGFDSLEAISSEKTNPFSARRHGITLGEGAAFFVMSRDPLDQTGICLLGYGESADAYHTTSPDPEGKGAFAAMENALKNAELLSCDIDYLNPHGTGTKFNDSMEAKAIGKLFGENCPAISATKPITGHTLGAAGAIEMAICYNSILANMSKGAGEIRLPLQVWDGEKDPELPNLNFIDKNNGCKLEKVKCCMSNTFAFGGANASLIIGIY